MNIDDISVKPTATIRDALKVIGQQGYRMALIVNNDKSLFGILTDSDIRRGLLDGMSLNDIVEPIVQRNPVIAFDNDSKKHILEIALKENKYEIPIVNKNGKVVNIESVYGILHKEMYANEVILMVGGLGTRLRPLTDDVPKPMLKVGKKPILQIIIERFLKNGFNNFTLCTGYKSKVIESYFGDGKEFSVNIKYVREDKRMGTAGALSRLAQIPKEPFFVMNGDILSDIDFRNMLRCHQDNKTCATMGTREFQYKVPYGVVESKKGLIDSILEKPIKNFSVNAGVYILNPEILKIIPRDSYFDMPNLFNQLIADKKKILKYDIDGYWIDIGRQEEFDRANESFFGK